MKLEVPEIPGEECTERLGFKFVKPELQICAGGEEGKPASLKHE